MYRLAYDDINIHFGVPPKAFEFDLIAMDTEFFGQEKNRLHRPHGKFGSLACTVNGVDVYMIFDEKEIQEFMDNCKPGTHVWHNAQYDYRQLRRFAYIPDHDRVWDTMLVDKVRFSGYYDSFGLNDLARRYLGLYLDKSVRDEFLEVPEDHKMTDEQIFYAAADVVATYYVAKEQMKQIDDDDRNVYENVEMPYLWVLLSSKGIPFDGKSWMERVHKAEEKIAELDAQIPFNPRSPKQVQEFLKENYKINTKSTDEKHLAMILAKHPNVKEIEMILTSRGLSKDAKTYGKKWVDAIEEDGRIYPSWNQILETGRMSAPGDVTIQTTPHAKEYRKCIIASRGCKLVIKDYSAQEPRILAYITQDEKLMDIFASGKDIYIAVGFEIFGEHFDKNDPRRKHMKSIILGLSYGMGISTLAEKMGVDEETATEWMNLFFEKFPGVKEWYDGTSEWTPYVTTIIGRKFWGNPYSNGWSRNYKNFPMQGSAADCTKIASAKAYEELGYNPFLIYMHDELVAEFTKDKLAHGERVMDKWMIDTQEWMHSGIPGSLETFIGADWSVKK